VHIHTKKEKHNLETKYEKCHKNNSITIQNDDDDNNNKSQSAYNNSSVFKWLLIGRQWRPTYISINIMWLSSLALTCTKSFGNVFTQRFVVNAGTSTTWSSCFNLALIRRKNERNVTEMLYRGLVSTAKDTSEYLRSNGRWSTKHTWQNSRVHRLQLKTKHKQLSYWNNCKTVIQWLYL